MTKLGDSQDEVVVENDVESLDKSEQKPTNSSDNLKIGIVVSAYFVISILLVFVNKIILDPRIFPFPLTMTWIQFVIQLTGLFSLRYIGLWVPSLSFLTKMELNWNDAKKVLPVSLIYISMIATNNICLQYVEVTFYQIARSLTILFTILFSFIFLKVKTSVSVMLACLIVFVGFLLGIKGEVHFSLIGLSFGIISSIFVSLYSVAVKKALSQLDFWETLTYNTILSIFLMLPIMYVMGEIDRVLLYENLFDPKVININILGGILGFFVSITIFFQIHYTSALTSNILGSAKGTIQTLLGAMIWMNPISMMNAIGIVLVIVGTAVYSYLRSK